MPFTAARVCWALACLHGGRRLRRRGPPTRRSGHSSLQEHGQRGWRGTRQARACPGNQAARPWAPGAGGFPERAARRVAAARLRARIRRVRRSTVGGRPARPGPARRAAGQLGGGAAARRRGGSRRRRRGRGGGSPEPVARRARGGSGGGAGSGWHAHSGRASIAPRPNIRLDDDNTGSGRRCRGRRSRGPGGLGKGHRRLGVDERSTGGTRFRFPPTAASAGAKTFPIPNATGVFVGEGKSAVAIDGGGTMYTGLPGVPERRHHREHPDDDLDGQRRDLVGDPDHRRRARQALGGRRHRGGDGVRVVARQPGGRQALGGIARDLGNHAVARPTWSTAPPSPARPGPRPPRASTQTASRLRYFAAGRRAIPEKAGDARSRSPTWARSVSAATRGSTPNPSFSAGAEPTGPISCLTWRPPHAHRHGRRRGCCTPSDGGDPGRNRNSRQRQRRRVPPVANHKSLQPRRLDRLRCNGGTERDLVPPNPTKGFEPNLQVTPSSGNTDFLGELEESAARHAGHLAGHAPRQRRMSLLRGRAVARAGGRRGRRVWGCGGHPSPHGSAKSEPPPPLPEIPCWAPRRPRRGASTWRSRSANASSTTNREWHEGPPRRAEAAHRHAGPLRPCEKRGRGHRERHGAETAEPSAAASSKSITRRVNSNLLAMRC